MQGFIRRSEGKYRAWKAPPELREALAIAKKESGARSKLLAVAVSDPRPAVDIGLSLMPFRR